MTGPDFGNWVRKLMRRRGEIVLVVPRGEGRVLLHTKPHYPPEIYRLPTGGIHLDEAADEAARREVFEEIGFKPQELLLVGVLDNLFLVDGNKLEYPSYVFKTEAYMRTPQPTDPNEPISGFREANSTELRDVARHLRGLPGGWSDWGKFRAAAHEWLAEYLNP